ncbi:hypothetical protein [Rhodoplanes azumiensis]|uniref:Uncharacterized protein n=1 Tax=Rhodoplanes azumiensis TaxID=1897628 RepID=A0ABW5AED6_9BRAD
MRIQRGSRLTPECRTRLAELARSRAESTFAEWHRHAYRDGPIARMDRNGPEPWARAAPSTPPTAPTFGGGRAPETNKPFFPWPPPTPSTRRAFSPDVVADRPRARTVGEVADRLRAITTAADFDQINYYAVPGGFALVTRIERLDAVTGRPLAKPDRWPSRAVVASAGISFWDIFGLVRTPGYHRIIVFVLTNKAVEMRPVGDDELQRLTEAWAQQGADFLDPEIRALPVTPHHALLVLVYEFERTGEETRHLRPSRWTLDEHLESIGASLKALP